MARFRKLLWALGVILSISAALSCSQQRAGTKPRSAAALAAETVTLEPPVVFVGSAGVRGGMARLDLTVGPNRTGRPQIIIAEDTPVGSGRTLRTSVWLAALVAAETLGEPLSSFSVKVATRGRIDGPSVGAMLAAGVIAARKRVKVKTDVTLTGTIALDGTVGAVGGLAPKLDAALVAGKRTFGFPAGQRPYGVASKGKTIGLTRYAAQRGGTVVELTTVYDAYKLLTGEPLVAETAVSTEAMKIDKRVSQVIRRVATDQWARVKPLLARAEVEARKRGVKERTQMKHARTWAQRARQQLAGGDPLAAYLAVGSTDYYARSALYNTSVRRWAAKEGKIPLPAALTNNSVAIARIIDNLKKRLGTEQPDTFLTQLMSADWMTVTKISLAAAKMDLDRPWRRGADAPATPMQAIERRARLLYRLANAHLKNSMFLMDAELFSEISLLPRSSAAGLKLVPVADDAVAHLVLSAEMATTTYVDMVSYLPRRHPSRRKFFWSPPTGLGVIKLTLPRLRASVAGPLPLNRGDTVIKLSMAKVAFLAAEALTWVISKILASSGRERAPIDGQRMLRIKLKHGERRARRYAARVKRVLGLIPLSAKVYYQIARTRERQRAFDHSVEYYHAAVVECQTALRLFRRSKPAP
jgi:Lon protease (S16) C-terminal proteolytic domain